MIVHIGYHKTGTSFLQQHVFPNMQGINYYDYAYCTQLFAPLLQQNTLQFNANIWAKKLHQNPNTLYSFESLVGNMGTGLYNVEIAYRLKAMGFTKIIISIRNQQKMLESLYRQYIQQGGVVKSKAFFDEKMGLFNWHYCDYYPLICKYVQLFGKQNVHILSQESLRNEASIVIQNLVQFTGAKGITPNKAQKANNSLSSTSIHLLRIINHFTYNYYRPSNLLSNKISTWKFRYLLQQWIDPFVVAKLFRNRPFVAPHLTQKALNYYAPNNKKLAHEFKLNLAPYNYW